MVAALKAMHTTMMDLQATVAEMQQGTSHMSSDMRRVRKAMAEGVKARHRYLNQ